MTQRGAPGVDTRPLPAGSGIPSIAFITTLVLAAVLLVVWAAIFLVKGSHFLAGFWPIEAALTSVFALMVLFVWDQFPRSVTLTPDGIALKHLLGTTRVAWTDIRPPTSLDGRFVVFGTSTTAPGYRGAAMRVDKRTAKQILLSPKRPPWPIPLEFQRFLEEP